MCIHHDTAAAIAANEPGYAQMTRGDAHDIISWHGDGFSETRHSGWDLREARCALIDAWARGKARITAGTFTELQILHRAEQWWHGRGPRIAPGDRNRELAEQIRRLVAHGFCEEPA
jgi:hypothetical protein